MVTKRHGIRQNRTQPQAPFPRREKSILRPIQLPPLSFPGCGPLRKRSGRKAAKLRRIHAPSGGNQRLIMPQNRQLSAATYPRGLD